jgi:hypothetical protein
MPWTRRAVKSVLCPNSSRQVTGTCLAFVIIGTRERTLVEVEKTAPLMETESPSKCHDVVKKGVPESFRSSLKSSPLVQRLVTSSSCKP